MKHELDGYHFDLYAEFGAERLRNLAGISSVYSARLIVRTLATIDPVSKPWATCTECWHYS